LLARACGAALASLGRQIALIKEFERKSGSQHGIGKRKNILVILVLFIHLENSTRNILDAGDGKSSNYIKERVRRKKEKMVDTARP